MMMYYIGWLRAWYFFFYHVPPTNIGWSDIDIIACICQILQVREQGPQKGEANPYLEELQKLEEQAKQKGLGRWSKASVLSSVIFVMQQRRLHSFFSLVKNLIWSLFKNDVEAFVYIVQLV